MQILYFTILYINFKYVKLEKLIDVSPQKAFKY